MKKVLFVCSGNTCRSPMAKALFNSIADSLGPSFDYTSTSAGLNAYEGDPASSNAIAALQDLYNISIEDHRAHQLNSSDIEESFLILTMGRGHKHFILSLFPEAVNKTYTLMEFAYNAASSDIKDPYGCSLDAYKLCAREISDCVGIIIKKLEND